MNYAKKIMELIDEIDGGTYTVITVGGISPSEFKEEMERRGVDQGFIYKMSTHVRKYPYYSNWLIEKFPGNILIGGRRPK